jgi:hypothetical protein
MVNSIESCDEPSQRHSEGTVDDTTITVAEIAGPWQQANRPEGNRRTEDWIAEDGQAERRQLPQLHPSGGRSA